MENFFSDGRRTRPYDTVRPLASALRLKIDHHCERDDAKCVRRAVRNASANGKKNILVCWEHKMLGEIADKLGYDDLDYPDDRFDLIYRMKQGKLVDVATEKCPMLDSSS